MILINIRIENVQTRIIFIIEDIFFEKDIDDAIKYSPLIPKPTKNVLPVKKDPIINITPKTMSKNLKQHLSIHRFTKKKKDIP